MRLDAALLLWLSLSNGCAGRTAESGPDQAEPATASAEPGVSATPGSSQDGGAPIPEPPPGASLPEVKIENVGMHVGGGANDPASKEPFQRALAKQFPELLACYRLMEEPKSGTFGVDLHIPRGGGRPRVEQPRTALPGEAFRACMIRVFEATEFEKTKLPVVISYSVRFSLGS